jgi:predicted RNA-binding protein YlxR (DUF448 family)
VTRGGRDKTRQASGQVAERTGSERAGSERTCIVTRAKLPPEELLRFVLGPEGEVAPDLKRKLPGRGVWVQATARAVAEAVRRKAFARGFKAPAQAAEDMAERVDALLEKDALQSLAMANKAGLVVAGAFKVETEIARQAPRALVHARDGSPDGARKIASALARRGEGVEKTPRVELFASCQLDLALGRANVIHAALRKGAASDAFLARCRRLAHYRAGGMAEGPPDGSDETQDESQDAGPADAPASGSSTSGGTAPGS